MDEEQLVQAFEAGRVPDGSFGHAEHVRVAWWYLGRYPLAEALGRFSGALRAFAAAQGQPGRYHETVTVAYLLLIHERLAGCAGESWAAFAGRNPDLLAWQPSVLDRYYRPETLASERARQTFVMPDRLAQ